MERAQKTDQDYREELTPEQYRITRQGGTERAFTGEHFDRKEPGTYTCVCCGAELFSSEDKYDSGTGWPSFLRPMHQDQVAQEQDTSLGMRRTEVLCASCDAHLGHVFDDGPAPTGKRFCINSAALEFEGD